MRVAITGASGFVGGAIARAATARGDRWNGLTRRANAQHLVVPLPRRLYARPHTTYEASIACYEE